MGKLSGITDEFLARVRHGGLRFRTPRPFAGLALAACLGILLGEAGNRCFGHGPVSTWPMGPWIGCLGFFTLALIFTFTLRRSLCLALAVMGFATIHLFRLNNPASTGLADELSNTQRMPNAGQDEEEPDNPPPEHAPSANQILRAAGVILDEPRGSATTGKSVGAGGGKNWRFTLRLTRLAVHGRDWKCHAHVMVFWRNGPDHLSAGEHLEMTGTGGGIAGPRNPGEFDMASFLRRRDIRTEIRCSGITDVHRLPANGRTWLPALPVMAQRFQAWTQHRLTLDLEDDPEVSAVISTLLLGLRSEPGLGDLEGTFQRTGTLHFFAIDGLKLGLFSLLLVRLLTMAGLRRQWALSLVLPVLALYALATGLGPASLRAVVVAAVFAGGEWMDRPAKPLNSLGAAAVLILGIDTNQLFDLGFQLTFLVVLAILLLGVSLRSALIRFGAPDPFLPPKLFSPVLKAFEWLRHRVIELACISCAASLGSLPLTLIYFHVISPISLLANVAVFPVAFGIICLGVLSLVLALLSLPQVWAMWINNSNWLLAKSFLLSVRFFDAVPGGSFYAALPEWRWEQPAAEVSVLDLERGARGIHLHVQGGGDWLIDTGRAYDYQRVILPFLHSRGIGRLEGMILSQADSFHLAAAPLVLADFFPGHLFDSGITNRSTYQRDFIKALERKRLPLIHWQRGNVLPFTGENGLRVLYPPERPTGKAAGDKALVLQLRAAGWRVLFLGDGGTNTAQWLSEQEAPETLRCDILVAGSSMESLKAAPDFLRAVAPRLVVQEAPKKAGFGAVASLPMPVISAVMSGAIRLRLYPQRVEATGFVDGKSIIISR